MLARLPRETDLLLFFLFFLASESEEEELEEEATLSAFGRSVLFFGADSVVLEPAATPPARAAGLPRWATLSL